MLLPLFVVQENTSKLTEAWSELLNAIQIKDGQLKLILTAQQFFFEVAEVESWIKDKNSGMKAAEFGKEAAIAKERRKAREERALAAQKNK